MKLHRVCLALSSLLLFTACPDQGLICPEGQVACGEGSAATCQEFRSDPDNCGGCGVACGDGQACVEGSCRCQPGATFADGACVFTSFDADNCGTPGTVCGADRVCSAGACVSACPASATRCGRSCVELTDNDVHCGACDNACGSATSCHAGTCEYDVVAACSTNGQLVGMQAGSDLLGPTRAVGTNRPMALAPLRDVILVPDVDQGMVQARQSDLVTVGTTVGVGTDARFVLTEDPFVYVVNSVSGTLQIFEAGGASGGGHELALRAELPLSETDQGNTFAQGVAKSGSTLYIPLQGGFGAAAAEGQKVLRVNVSNPSLPAREGAIDLTTVALNSFDGGVTLPRPADAVVHRGALYVALTNLDEAYAPGGPGILAKVDLATGNVTAITLDSNVCLAPTELVSSGDRLLVSCLGKVEYSWTHPYPIVKAEKSGLVVLDGNDAPLAHWTPGGCQDGNDAGCLLAVPSRFAVLGDDVYLGDQNGGRMFVLELKADGGIVERRGFHATSGPLQACPVDPERQVSNLIDVLAVP